MKIQGILAPALAVFLTSCSGKEYTESDFFAMDTYMTVSVAGTEDDAAAAEAEIHRLDLLLTRENINLSDAELQELVRFSFRVSELTGGAFDITVGPLCDIWGFQGKNYRVPSAEEIAAALALTGYEKISVTDSAVTLPSGMSLDFGAIGKGYAGDKVSELLKSRNVTSAIISLGGNVHATGARSDSSDWRVGIRDPFTGADYLGYVDVTDKAVVTSGGYERYFESGGKKYVHIIDPDTGAPSESDIASVTVISQSGALADALSTALYVMGSEGAERFCKETGCKAEGFEFAAVIVKDNGDIKTVGDIKFTERKNDDD